jgi:phospholipid/cholesterol/gamma-HCH transport system substrate-binding protein
MKRSLVEITTGLFVVVGILALVFISVKYARMEFFTTSGYNIYAEFENVGGLKTGAIVEIAGVEVGRVRRITLTEDNMARVEMHIYEGVKIPEDTIAAIRTKGLIGDKYIELSPGGSDTYLADGGEIMDTQSAVDIEGLISKFVFGKVEGENTDTK